MDHASFTMADAGWPARQVCRGIRALLILLLLAAAAPVSAHEWTIGPADSIQDAITAAADGDTIILNPGTYFQGGIVVNRSITIRANTSQGGTAANTIIDGRSQARIFTSPAASASSLTLDRVTIKNGCTESNGGAVYTNGSVTVSSSAFINCTVTGRSGAGGAIASGGPVAVTATTFTNCTSEGDSGAVSVINNTLDVTSSTFSYCSARGDGGTIKVIFGNLTVTSSTFSGSSSHADGGTIKVIFGNLTVTSSTFSGSASQADGGAVKVIFGDVALTSSRFSRCSAHSDGGAVKVIFGNQTVASSAFSDCYAHSDGGAIKEIIGNLDVTSTDFSRCRSRVNGGAISAYVGILAANAVSITDCQSEDGDGGAIFQDDGSIGITSSAITGCSAKNGSVISASAGTIRFSRLVRDNVSSVVSSPSGSISATDTWWGTNGDPFGFVNGSVTASPWLVLGITASPAAVRPGQPVTIRANLTFNSSGGDVSALGHIPDGTPVVFSVSGGTGSFPAATVTTVNGTAETLFTTSGSGPVVITATVDGTTVAVPLTVAESPPDTTATVPPPDSDSDGGAALPGQAAPARQPAAGVSTIDVNVGGNSAVNQVTVTGTRVGSIVVTGTVVSGPGPGMPAAPGTVYQYLTLVPAGYSTITGADIVFSIPESWFAGTGLNPENIAMERYAGSRWNTLPTTVIRHGNGFVVYTAKSPGFSYFAIIGIARSPAAGIAGEPGKTEMRDSPAARGTTAPPAAPAATTAPAVPAPAPQDAPGIPLVLAFAGIGGVLLVAIGIIVRRWWLRRQNPALFGPW